MKIIAAVLVLLLLPFAGVLFLASAAAQRQPVSADKVALAAELVAAIDNGTLTGSDPDHLFEVKAIAAGRVTPGCDLDVRVLQILVIALHEFKTIQVSDLNRRCTGQSNVGAGTASSHWKGAAIDFVALGGVVSTGWDNASLRLLRLLEPIVPPGTRAGQAGCRTGHDVRLQLPSFTQFSDSCDHLHIDVAYAGNVPLLSTTR